MITNIAYSAVMGGTCECSKATAAALAKLIPAIQRLCPVNGMPQKNSMETER